MSSSDAGPKKRFKDKKRKKGSIGELGPPIIQQHDTEHKKFVLDETIHVQKDAHVGGNILSKLIFISVLLFLGVSLVYMLNQNDTHEGSDNTSITPWLMNLISSNYFWSKEKEKSLTEQNDDIQPEEISQYSYWDYLFPFVSFMRTTYQEPENFEKDFAQEIDNEGNEGTEEQFNDHLDDQTDESMSEDRDDDSGEREDDKNEENERYDRNLKDDPDGDDDDDDDDENNEPTNRGYVYQSPHSSYKFDTDHEDHNENYSDERFKNDDDDDENESSEEERYEDTRDDDHDEENNEDHRENEEDDYRPENSDERPGKDDDSREDDAEELPHSSSDDAEKTSENEPDSMPASEDDTKPSHVITKLGVGVALIFVAYTVIIRKWNNYVDHEEQTINIDEIENIHNQEIRTSVVNAEKNNSDLLQALETPSSSGSEDELDYSPGGRISADEIEDSESYTETSGSDMNESDIEPSATFDRYTSGYGKANITNEYDWKFRDDLDDADEDFDRGKLDIAMEKYDKILRIEKNSARAKYGISRIFDRKAELLKSNRMLTQAISVYKEVLKAPNVPNILLKSVLERLIDRMTFKGDYDQVIPIHEFAIERFPDEVKYQNDLVVSLLMLNRMSEAERKLEKILKKWPNDGMALVHYGFVLKMKGNLTEAIDFLRRGVNSQETGTQDGRFYFHLGDALQKLKRDNEAMQVYEKAVTKKLFPSKYQRSLYNVDRLTARPWWSLEQSTYSSFFKTLETNWKTIRNEVLQLLKNGKESPFREEAEKLREVGDWKQFELFSRGKKNSQCDKAPFTCRMVGDFQPASRCRRGQIKFSIMEPGTHVWPHCGPTNCRLRAHLGLIIPSNVTIRVADETKTWKEGEVLIFDDSFEHEVWHNGTTRRLILIVDVWHPELTEYERRTLSAI